MARSIRVPKIPNPLSRGPQIPDDQYEDVFEEMTLAQHLEELRSRVWKACASIALGFIIGIILANPLLTYIHDTTQVQSFDVNDVTENVTDFFKVALYIALTVAFPIIFYQMFSFIAPGLTRKEKRIVFSSIPFSILFFALGASFAFFFAVPRAFAFLTGFNKDLYEYTPTFGSVAAFYIQVSLGMGLAFQAPIVMFLLARLGIVSPSRMRKSRRYAAVIVLIAAALITPTPDPINMMIVAVPIYIIFEVGLIFAQVGANRHRKSVLEGTASSPGDV